MERYRTTYERDIPIDPQRASYPPSNNFFKPKSTRKKAYYTPIDRDGHYLNLWLNPLI